MTHVETIQVPRYHLEFTRKEVELMVRCAQAHYDHKCQQLEKNGFINGLRNSLNADGLAEWGFWFRDIDLLCKVLEIGRNLPDDNAKEVRLLSWSLQQVLRTQP